MGGLSRRGNDVCLVSPPNKRQLVTIFFFFFTYLLYNIIYRYFFQLGRSSPLPSVNNGGGDPNMKMSIRILLPIFK